MIGASLARCHLSTIQWGTQKLFLCHKLSFFSLMAVHDVMHDVSETHYTSIYFLWGLKHFFLWVAAELELIPADWVKGELCPRLSPTNRRPFTLTLTCKDNLESLMNRTYMFLNMGGKSNSADKKKKHTHRVMGRTCKQRSGRPEPKSKIRSIRTVGRLC